MDDKVLTISIAAYNVEKYLDQTLRSLYDSRFLKDIEVLIIDDGSRDRTGEIGLKYENMAPGTFRYIRKENGGHGSTINMGIQQASGRYFRCVDGDDWVDTKTFAAYVECLKQTDADMVLTPFKTDTDGHEELVRHVKGMVSGRIYTWADNPEISLVTIHMLTICTRLLRENQVKITEKCFYVDIEFDVWAIYLSRTITYYNLPAYIYRKGHQEQSINIVNMVKNLKMQETVCYRLAQLYEDFLRSKELPEKQKQALFHRISVSLYWTIRSYLCLPDRGDSKTRIISFEKEIGEMSPELYRDIGDTRLFKILRRSHYCLVPELRIIYKHHG